MPSWHNLSGHPHWQPEAGGEVEGIGGQRFSGYYDEITGLASRMLFLERRAERLRTAEREQLKLTVIAEGVDSDDQAAMLLQLKCEQIQGFLVSKPLPMEEMARLLARE